MTRICSNCEFENQDDYDFCAKCGTPLVEGVESKDFIVLKHEEPKINKKAIFITYIITIALSWCGFIIGVLFKNSSVISFTFFGLFMPIFLLQDPDWNIKKHGLIQLLISVVGVVLSIYVFLS